MIAPWKKIYDKQRTKKQRHYFADKILPVKAIVFPGAMDVRVGP